MVSAAALEQINRACALGLMGCRIGGHFYPRAPRLTSSCVYGCGCWMGPSRSGVRGIDLLKDPHPLKLDPFGACPLAPVVPPPIWRRIATWPILA